MSSLRGSLFSETFPFDGGRLTSVYVPPGPARSVVYAADGGWHTERLGRALESATNGSPSTLVVGVHGLNDDDGRLCEYVESFGSEHFEAFEQFFVQDVRAWVRSVLGVTVPAERTAVWGASLGAELALALGLRHRETYGVVLGASPSGGFTPTSRLSPPALPRTYLIGGTQEQWFLDNACRWAEALRVAGADVVMRQRDGEHGGMFWYDEFPLMVTWAFTP